MSNVSNAPNDGTPVPAATAINLPALKNLAAAHYAKYWELVEPLNANTVLANYLLTAAAFHQQQFNAIMAIIKGLDATAPAVSL
jgi:hypothetical protein